MQIWISCQFCPACRLPTHRALGRSHPVELENHQAGLENHRVESGKRRAMPESPPVAPLSLHLACPVVQVIRIVPGLTSPRLAIRTARGLPSHRLSPATRTALSLCSLHCRTNSRAVTKTVQGLPSRSYHTSSSPASKTAPSLPNPRCPISSSSSRPVIRTPPDLFNHLFPTSNPATITVPSSLNLHCRTCSKVTSHFSHSRATRLASSPSA